MAYDENKEDGTEYGSPAVGASELKATLERCPFCGRTPILIFRGSGWDVACKTFDCYLEEGADWYLGKEQAVLMWNKRSNATVEGRAAFGASLSHDGLEG